MATPAHGTCKSRNDIAIDVCALAAQSMICIGIHAEPRLQYDSEHDRLCDMLAASELIRCARHAALHSGIRLHRLNTHAIDNVVCLLERKMFSYPIEYRRNEELQEGNRELHSRAGIQVHAHMSRAMT